MKKNNTFRRAAALMAALSITVSLAAPAFAATSRTYYIDGGDITITKDEHGKQTVQQGSNAAEKIGDDDEIIITTSNADKTTLESDLEGPAAEDSGFGPVVEDNYQPAQPEDAEKPEGTAQPEDAEKPEGAAQPESAEEPKSADQHESAEQDQPQQAAPAAAPAASTPVNKKENGFWGNTITVINNCVSKALNLTLKDVKIDVSDTGGQTGIPEKAALSVQGKGNVEIELDGDNVLKSAANKAGLEKNESDSTGMLTLKDDNKDGSLRAEAGGGAAGIGGDSHKNTKNITITGGTVEAVGGSGGGAGIGGGYRGGGKNIIINGGAVTATTTGGESGAGIGGGSGGDGGDIFIISGTVKATGGKYGAGIGGGEQGNGKNITITGGSVTAFGGEFGAGIGGGDNGGGENITISGGTVKATGGKYGAGIGGGKNSDADTITISGGTVTAQGGENGAGIGGGNAGSGMGITIEGGTVTAAGGDNGAGIGGGNGGDGEDIAISNGTVNATGGIHGAGIGGGRGGSGSDVTVSGAAQVTANAGKGGDQYGPGATIGNGGTSNRDSEGAFLPGEEIDADITGLTPGYIHHVIYNEDGSVKREWWEPESARPTPEVPQPTPDGPNAPAEESNEVDLGTPVLHVETLEGAPLPFNARKQGSTLRVTTDNLAARLHGTRQALEALREQGVEQIEFVTTLKTTTLPVAELLAEGGSWFALEHDGLVSRRLSAAQAESLKCWMH